MTFPLVLRPEADEEYQEAQDYYERVRSGLGRRFMSAVETELNRICANPFIRAKMYGEVRASVVQGFPYCIYYFVETNEVVVISIFHTSQNPSKWQLRVDPH